uniref:Secreted protein n=1 Tax=Tanacetum cinerariifolium TaxID=118510 RepID=A0A6L2MGN0_TANCI|nr:hypothetical protein [Tanacetum cinerariifolium]
MFGLFNLLFTLLHITIRDVGTPLLMKKLLLIQMFFMSDQVGEYQGAYKDLLRFCIMTIWDKGLEREQNVGVPIYGERSDLLISEVGNHGAKGCRCYAFCCKRGFRYDCCFMKRKRPGKRGERLCRLGVKLT